MADLKVTSLTELTTPADEDLLYIVDDPGGTPESKKITRANLLAGIGSGTSTIGWVVDGGGDVLTTGVKADLPIDVNCAITQWTAVSSSAGYFVGDIWRCNSIGDFPPTVSETIVSSTPPTISNSVAGTSTSLTGWSTSITAGNILRFNVTSVSSIGRVTLALRVTV